MKVIDISGPIETDMWSYGHPFPPVQVSEIATLEKEGYSAHRLDLHTLAGTYLETANHLFPDRETIDQVAPSRLVVRAWVAQLPDKKELEMITAAELEQAVGRDLAPGDALLIATGWDRMWNEPGFISRCPFFAPDTMRWIVERGVALLGVDIPSIQDPRTMESEELSHLQIYYESDRLLLAPVVRLREAGKGPYTLAALPLSVPGVCSTPCRAVLLQDDAAPGQRGV